MNKYRYGISTVIFDRTGCGMVGTDNDDAPGKSQEGCKCSIGFCDEIAFLPGKTVMPGFVSSLDIDQDKIFCFQFLNRSCNLSGNIAVLRIR